MEKSSTKTSKVKRIRNKKSTNSELYDDNKGSSNQKSNLPTITIADISENNHTEGDDDDKDEIDEDEESPFRDPPIGAVRLRPSQFINIPSTVFVEYPPELNIKRNDMNFTEPLGNRKLEYKSYWERICIRNAHCRAGFVKSDRHWTSLWSKHQNVSQMKELNCLQKINHFPASWCIGRKDRLSRTLNAMKRTFGEVYNFHPETYILPQEKASLARAIQADFVSSTSKSSSSSASSNPFSGSMWIVKPCASSCGQGIKVMTSQQALHLPQKKKAIVQRYLAKPYLINGNKFDLRIYVLVTGVDPLRVYIHDEGLTRISTSKYTLKNLDNRFAHLTNYSINKKADTFKAAAFVDNSSNQCADGIEHENDAEMEGFKWSLAAFRRWLSKKEGKEVMEATFDRIFDLCLKTVIAAESEITPNLHSTAQYRTNCFELFGCDVILDTDLNAHLLEVNVSPSLMGSSPLDKKIKGIVVADLLHIVGLYPYDPVLLKKFNSHGTTSDNNAVNPFTFASLSKLMHDQEKYRRNPCSESVDMCALGDTDTSWLLLLMVEDELQRAKSSRFHLVHPTPTNAVYYTDLYRSCRFSDHLLAHWVTNGMSQGKYGVLIPQRYRPRNNSTGFHSPSSRPISSSKYKMNTLDSYNNKLSNNDTMRARSVSRQRPSSSSRTRIYSSNRNEILNTLDDSNRTAYDSMSDKEYITAAMISTQHRRGKSEPRVIVDHIIQEHEQQQQLKTKSSQLADKLRTEVLNSSEKDSRYKHAVYLDSTNSIDDRASEKQTSSSYTGKSIGKALTLSNNTGDVLIRNDRSTNHYIPSNSNRLILENSNHNNNNNALTLSDKKAILSIEREILSNNTSKLIYSNNVISDGKNLAKRSLFNINKASIQTNINNTMITSDTQIIPTLQSSTRNSNINYSENMDKAKFHIYGNLENIKDFHSSSYSSSSPVSSLNGATADRATPSSSSNKTHQVAPHKPQMKQGTIISSSSSRNHGINYNGQSSSGHKHINTEELYKVNKINGMLEIFQPTQVQYRRKSNSNTDNTQSDDLAIGSADSDQADAMSRLYYTKGIGQQIKSNEKNIEVVKYKSGSLSARR